MRGTIHLVTARDCLALRPAIQAVTERVHWTASPFGKRLGDADPKEVVAAGRKFLEGAPRTRAQIRDHLAERWPDRDAEAMAHTVTYLLPVVQIPPRGLWSRSGRATLATVESWLGRPLDGDPAPDRAVLRYLGAFGPASVKDVAMWSGFTRVREVVERLRGGLRTFRDENGVELFDLPDAPLARPGHARARALPAGVRQRLPLARRPLAHRRPGRPSRDSASATTASSSSCWSAASSARPGGSLTATWS